MDDESRVKVVNHRKPETAAAILRVQREAYEVEARIIGFDEIPPIHETVDEVMALDLTILAVTSAGEPVAILGYSRSGSAVEIDRLAVRPDHFRRGLARRLITALHGREADATRFDVSTGRDNEPAVNLYRSLGYEPVADVALPEGVVITRFVRER